MTETHYKRAKETAKLFSMSIPTLYRIAKEPDFPKPLKVSKNITLWNIEEIEKYFKEKNR
jgi:predicted DNA-binding transcriptional regulator AlpA